MPTSKHGVSLTSLNPYSNGMKIELIWVRTYTPVSRLNPYSNGMKIEQDKKVNAEVIDFVLILILME